VDAVLPSRGLTLPSVSIVVPAYNEERRLAGLLGVLESSAAADLAAIGLELLEIVIVDDGSRDRTGEILHEAAARNGLLVPLDRGGGNEGKGAALAAGVDAARGELALLIDVDLSTPLSELGKLAERLERGADVAIASRDLPGSVVVNAPEHRKQIGRAFNLIVRVLTGLPFRDTQCGFKLMRTPTARALLREQLVPGFAFDVELLLRARAMGLSIAEVPVTYIHDRDSKVNPLAAAPRMAVDVLRLAWRFRRPRVRRASARPADHPD
jgi:dolichyl-phosphate beta-glucosyltransferase